MDKKQYQSTTKNITIFIQKTAKNKDKKRKKKRFRNKSYCHKQKYKKHL